MLSVSRTKRVIGTIINVVTFNFLVIGNLFLLITKGKTLGGQVMGYKYEIKGISLLLKLFIALIVAAIVYGITFSILFWYDLFTMSKRNGWMWEVWFGIKKK